MGVGERGVSMGCVAGTFLIPMRWQYFGDAVTDCVSKIFVFILVGKPIRHTFILFDEKCTNKRYTNILMCVSISVEISACGR